MIWNRIHEALEASSQNGYQTVMYVKVQLVPVAVEVASGRVLPSVQQYSAL